MLRHPSAPKPVISAGPVQGGLAVTPPSIRRASQVTIVASGMYQFDTDSMFCRPVGYTPAARRQSNAEDLPQRCPRQSAAPVMLQ